MDDMVMARNYALAHRTTVYMVFDPMLQNFPVTMLTNKGELRALTNRISGQFSSYNFVTLRGPGDQPGQGKARYLGEWKHLPEGVYIAPDKFSILPAAEWQRRATTSSETNLPFPRFVDIPFPISNSKPGVFQEGIPAIAFDFRGGLLGPERRPRQVDEFVTLTRGSIIIPRDANERPQFALPEIIDTPKGNDTNNTRVRIDWVTGRPRLELPRQLL
jgi:hypothetical protein